MEAAAEELKRAGRDPVRRRLHRPVRRPHAGHDRHVRQPAVPQRRRDDLPPADPLAADAQRRARRRHLRQGAARDDDGARRRAAICRACWCRAASRCRRPRARTPGKVQTIGARFAHGEITLEAGGRARLPRVRVARRRLPVPRHRGDVAGRRRGAWHVAGALRAGAVGPADLARHGAALAHAR